MKTLFWEEILLTNDRTRYDKRFIDGKLAASIFKTTNSIFLSTYLNQTKEYKTIIPPNVSCLTPKTVEEAKDILDDILKSLNIEELPEYFRVLR